MKRADEVALIIREAFFAVCKGEGIGLHEATAIDDYATEEDRAEARAKDVEEHWWDVSEEGEGQLGTALSFTDREGFRFLLPATMCRALDGSSDDIHSVQFHLCVCKAPYVPHAHHGYHEYTDYLRSIHPKELIEYFGFSSSQVRAIALFLQWADDDRGRDQELESRKGLHTYFLKDRNHEHYSLTEEDVVNNYDEERRILREWFELGRISTE